MACDPSRVLRWPIRLASVVAAAVLAYGWGDLARDPSPAGVVILGLLTAVLGVALIRLYRPGGMAAFQFEDDARPAPGEAVADPVERERERKRPEPAAVRAPVAATAPPAPAPAAAPRPAPAPPRARRASGGSLWSSDRATRAPEPSAPAAPAAAPRGADLLDLNTASADELAMLPGIGRGAAARIVAHREANGPFRSPSELAAVEGFDASRVNRVAARVRV